MAFFKEDETVFLSTGFVVDILNKFGYVILAYFQSNHIKSIYLSVLIGSAEVTIELVSVESSFAVGDL
jgi:hypothetical protein